MTLARPWQIELPARNILIGDGTVFTILRDPGPKGLLATAAVRTKDIQRHLVHGDSLGRDTFAPRMITIPVDAAGTGMSDSARQQSARTALRPLIVGWRPEPTAEIALDAWVPGTPETVMRYYGRPRDVGEQEWLLTFGRIRVLLLFVGTDPYAYGAAQTLTGQSGTFTVPAATTGDVGADSRRATITVYGNGGTPTISNAADGGTITFTAALAAGQTATLDLQALTAVRSGGVDLIPSISATSPWFPISGGINNVLTLTGAGTVDVSWRPAYF